MSDLEDWHCPGSGQRPLTRRMGQGICRGCGRLRALRLNGLVPKHPKIGHYAPSRDPKRPR